MKNIPTNELSKGSRRNFLEVQWLGLHTSTEGPWIQSLVGKLRSVVRQKTKTKKNRREGLQGKNTQLNFFIIFVFKRIYLQCQLTYSD